LGSQPLREAEVSLRENPLSAFAFGCANANRRASPCIKNQSQMKLCLHLLPSSLDPGQCEQDWRSRHRVFEAFLDSCGWSLVGGPEVEQSSGRVWFWRNEVDLVSEGATYSLIGPLRVWMSGPAGRTVLMEHNTVSILISQMNQLDRLLPRLRPFDTLR
jgi:hypothetical protein